MGRLIEVDVDKLKELLNENKIELTNNIISIVREEYISKADYENRLKVDMVAMLTEIQLEIEDLWEVTWNSDYRGGFKDGCIESNNLIQQKINALKAESGEDDH